MKSRLFVPFLFFLCGFLFGQNPVPGSWDDNQDIGFVLNTYPNPADRPQFDAFADELGIHVITRNISGGSITNQYRLIGNDGATYVTSEFTAFDHSDVRIIVLDNKVYVFTYNNTTQKLVGRVATLSYDPEDPTDEINVSSWVNTDNQALSGLNNVRITNIVLDKNNVFVHMVYQSGNTTFPETDTEVHYIGFDLVQNEWKDNFNVTNGTGTPQEGSGHSPRIALSGNKAHVVYLYHETEPIIGTDDYKSKNYCMVRERNLTSGMWQSHEVELEKILTQDDNIDPARFLDIAATVKDDTLLVSNLYLFAPGGGENSLENHETFVYYRPIGVSEWTQVVFTGSNIPLYTTAAPHINTHGISLHADKSGVFYTFSYPDGATADNKYFVRTYRIAGGSGTFSLDVNGGNKLGAGFTPNLTSNSHGVFCLWEQRDDPPASITGKIWIARFVKTIKPDDVCETGISITSDHSFWTGQVSFGPDNSETTNYACITIPSGKTVSMDDNAQLFLRGNRLYVQGTLYYYSANTTPGMVGEVIMAGGTVVDLSSGNSIISGEGACLYIEQGGKYIIKNSGLTLTFKDGALMVIDGGELEMADGAKLIFDSTSVNLDIRPGSTLKLGSDAEIVIESEIDASGSASSPITVTSLYSSPASSQYWKWIKVVGSGSGEADYGIVEYATLEYSDYGIYASNVPALQIKNNTIRHQRMSGIYLYSSYADIEDNSITFSDLLYGIYLNNSSPQLYSNMITDHNGSGVYCFNYSSPSLGSSTTSTEGYNVITDNDYGVRAHYYSNPFLGDDLEGRIGGYNSIYDNTSADIKVTSNCDVTARYNWWGQNPPDPRKLDVDGTSELDYGDPLEDDPQSSSKINLVGSSRHLGESGEVISSPAYTPENPSAEELFDLARIKRIEKNQIEAISLLKQIVEDHPASDEALWSLPELASIYREASIDSIVPYLQSVAANHSNSSVRNSADELTRREYIFRGSFQSAIVHAVATLSEEPSIAEEQNALYDLIVVYGDQLDDHSQALAYYQLMESKYPNEELTVIAGVLIDEITNPAIFSKGGLVSGSHGRHSEKTKTGFELFGNYPNPFNPETSIRFNLAKDNPVKIRIYDLNGRLVKTLVSRMLTEGEHSYIWDGRNDIGHRVASGIYLYRVQVANNAVATKKMLMIQ